MHVYHRLYLILFCVSRRECMCGHHFSPESWYIFLDYFFTECILHLFFTVWRPVESFRPADVKQKIHNREGAFSRTMSRFSPMRKVTVTNDDGQRRIKWTLTKHDRYVYLQQNRGKKSHVRGPEVDVLRSVPPPTARRIRLFPFFN